MALQPPKTPKTPVEPKTFVPLKTPKSFKAPKAPQAPQAPPPTISVETSSGGPELEDGIIHLGLQSPFAVEDWPGCSYDVQYTGSGIGFMAGSNPLDATELNFINSPTGTPFTFTVKVVGDGLVDSASRTWPGISDIELDGSTASPPSNLSFASIGTLAAVNGGSVTYEMKNPSGSFVADFNDGPRGVNFNIGLLGSGHLAVGQISPSFPYVPGVYRLTVRATDSNGSFLKLFEINLT